MPLVDGRLVRGPRGVLLPGDGLPPGLDALGLRIVHQDAASDVLLRLGAVEASPRTVLADPAVRAAVENAADPPDAMVRSPNTGARVRPDVEAEPAVGHVVVRCDPRLSASASKAAATTTSVGSSAVVRERVRAAELLGHLSADEDRVGALPEVVRTPSLSSTFAPPETRTNGRSTSPSSRPSISSSCSSRSPAYAGRRCATPSVDACARCAEPNASFT